MMAPWSGKSNEHNITTILAKIEEKLDQVIASYVTRQDLGALRSTIEDRFMENKVANERFNNITERLEKIETQLTSNADRQRNNQFITHNNSVYWIIAITSIGVTLLIYLSEHLAFH